MSPSPSPVVLHAQGRRAQRGPLRRLRLQAHASVPSTTGAAQTSPAPVVNAPSTTGRTRIAREGAGPWRGRALLFVFAAPPGAGARVLRGHSWLGLRRSVGRKKVMLRKFDMIFVFAADAVAGITYTEGLGFAKSLPGLNLCEHCEDSHSAHSQTRAP